MADKLSNEQKRERAVRMVDFGMEEAEITFDLRAEVTEEEVDAVRRLINSALGVVDDDNQR